MHIASLLLSLAALNGIALAATNEPILRHSRRADSDRHAHRFRRDLESWCEGDPKRYAGCIGVATIAGAGGLALIPFATRLVNKILGGDPIPPDDLRDIDDAFAKRFGRGGATLPGELAAKIKTLPEGTLSKLQKIAADGVASGKADTNAADTAPTFDEFTNWSVEEQNNWVTDNPNAATKMLKAFADAPKTKSDLTKLQKWMESQTDPVDAQRMKNLCESAGVQLPDSLDEPNVNDISNHAAQVQAQGGGNQPAVVDDNGGKPDVVVDDPVPVVDAA